MLYATMIFLYINIIIYDIYISTFQCEDIIIIIIPVYVYTDDTEQSLAQY